MKYGPQGSEAKLEAYIDVVNDIETSERVCN
jgi:hypothetical protein